MKDIEALDLIKLIAGVLTPAAVFYAVGYVITQAYITATGLQASFWFTENFYREAGARFLLDIVVSIALLPHVFIVLTGLLVALYPREIRALGRKDQSELPVEASHRRRARLTAAAFLLVVLTAGLVLVILLRSCGQQHCLNFVQLPAWFFSSSWLFAEAQRKWLEQQPLLYPMSIFLVFAVPTVVTLGMLALRALKALKNTEQGYLTTSRDNPVAMGLLAFLIASAFVVFTFYIPIAYGVYFYDFVVVSLVDNDKCAVDSAAKVKLVECYLLGQFETRYILIGREENPSMGPDGIDDQTDNRIYIKQIEKLEPFAVESSRPLPLRGLTTLDPSNR